MNFEDMSRVAPQGLYGPEVDAMLDQLVAWTEALSPLRTVEPAETTAA